MKEATGEFSMTVVTIIAVVAIVGVIALLKDPLTNWVNSIFEGQFGGYTDPAKNPQ